MQKYGNNWFKIRGCIPDAKIHNFKSNSILRNL